MAHATKNKDRMDVTVNRHVLLLIRDMHKAYRERYGSNVSFASYIEMILMSYLKSDTGKSLLKAMHAKKKGL